MLLVPFPGRFQGTLSVFFSLAFLYLTFSLNWSVSPLELEQLVRFLTNYWGIVLVGLLVVWHRVIPNRYSFQIISAYYIGVLVYCGWLYRGFESEFFLLFYLFAILFFLGQIFSFRENFFVSFHVPLRSLSHLFYYSDKPSALSCQLIAAMEGGGHKAIEGRVVFLDEYGFCIHLKNRDNHPESKQVPNRLIVSEMKSELNNVSSIRVSIRDQVFESHIEVIAFNPEFDLVGVRAFDFPESKRSFSALKDFMKRLGIMNFGLG